MTDALLSYLEIEVEFPDVSARAVPNPNEIDRSGAESHLFRMPPIDDSVLRYADGPTRLIDSSEYLRAMSPWPIILWDVSGNAPCLSKVALVSTIVSGDVVFADLSAGEGKPSFKWEWSRDFVQEAAAHATGSLPRLERGTTCSTGLDSRRAAWLAGTALMEGDSIRNPDWLSLAGLDPLLKWKIENMDEVDRSEYDSRRESILHRAQTQLRRVTEADFRTQLAIVLDNETLLGYEWDPTRKQFRKDFASAQRG
jgi:hypothetical protein